MSAIPAIAASAVTGAIGVNTHIDFGSPGYGDPDLHTLIAAVKYLGVKRLRDCPGKDADLSGPRAWSVVSAATGCTFLAFIGETSPANAPSQLARFAPLAAQGILDGIEGPNEWDAAFAVNAGATLPAAAAFLQTVFAEGQALKLPVVNISFGAGWHAPLWEGNYRSQGDLAAFCDYANAHTYPQPGQTVESALTRLTQLAGFAATRPVMTTEIGWPKSQFPNQADVARFVLTSVLDAALYGNPRLYFYALFDDVAGAFGLMNADGTPKPSGTALRNLLAVLADPGTATPGALDYTVTGTTANDRSLLMAKANGVFLLALWNETDAAHNVVVTLASPAAQVSLYDPLFGSAPVQTLTNVTSITVNLPTHPLIIAISGAGVIPVPPPTAQTPTSLTLTPASVTLADTAAFGTKIATVAVATSDGQPFAGLTTVDPPLAIAGGVLSLAAPLSGPATLAPIVTASANGVSVATPLTLTVTHVVTPTPPKLTPSPLFGPPSSLLAIVGQVMPLVGLAVSDQWAVGHAGTMALNLSVKTGSLTMLDVTGQPYPGSATASISIKGGIVAINRALATLVYTAHQAGPDTLIMEIFDQAGISSHATIPITIS